MSGTVTEVGPWLGTESGAERLEWSAALSPGLCSRQKTQIWTAGRTVCWAEADRAGHLTVVVAVAAVVEVVAVTRTVEAEQWRKVEN